MGEILEEMNEHPLDNHLNIIPHWYTPIGTIELNLPEVIRLQLIELVCKKAYKKRKRTNDPKSYSDSHQYNLFGEFGNVSCVKYYQHHLKEIIEYYISRGWFNTSEDYDIYAKTFANIQKKGRRTFPHYHHGFDGVVVHYLTIGNEFDWVDEELIKSEINEIVDKQDDYEMFATHSQDFEKDGNLLINDPRPAISYPFNQKSMHLVPRKGLTVIMPAYLWHESNTYNGNGIRVTLNTNFRMETISTRLVTKL